MDPTKLNRNAAVLVAAITLALTLGTMTTSAGPNAGKALSVAAGQIGQAGQDGPLAPVGSAFTYQGSLKNGGNPANGQYDFTFKLFDALSAGNQVGSTVTVANQTVTGGLFTVQLDFGSDVFGGQARWLEIAVRPSGGGTYTTLAPRQPLTAVPYAQSLATGSNGAVITGTLPGPALIVTNTNAVGVQGTGGTSSYGVRGYGGIGLYGITTVVNGVGVRGDSQNGYGVHGFSSSGTAVFGQSNTGWGIAGNSTGNGIGVRGESTNGFGGLFINNSTTGYAALQGYGNGNPGYGIYGEGNSIGVWGSTLNGTGVRGATTGGYGVHGYSVSNGTGVRGESSQGSGVHGIAGGYGTGVRGASDDGTGVLGSSSSGYGVHGESDTSTGVFGFSLSNTGVYGFTNGLGRTGVLGVAPMNSYGVQGQGGTGVYGRTNVNNGVGVRGESTAGYGIHGWSSNGWAGWFDGNVNVTGGCCEAAEGTFKIDHPLDPENKYLVQSAVQSADMISTYSGNATTDARGEAIVTLPSYVEALNNDFRYQLTIMGEQFAQARISSKIKNNRFTIKTDKPNIEVSWQVTGARQDPYAQAHPVVPEVDKPADEQGKYRHPAEWGQPESKGIGYEERERMKNEQPAPADPRP